MFLPHCFHIGLFGNNQELMDSMRLVSALAVENELQESWRREIEQSDDNRNETTQRERDNGFFET
ncbi:MAG: hypothetical protein ABSF90_21215 [Syntrophobacteraceae bacterium]|jgi:hypothetical protein